ncbi:MAG: TetR/AcrR family transcriptional regulator [Ktedonobacterales bacterium]|nr:TetR/AcrR family transcriptional regulator [Ktedonobacterales bacterium]
MKTLPHDAALPNRTQRRKARTAQAIIEAAEQQFLEHGYAPTTLEAIAEAADVAVGSIYFHFAGKDDLYLAVMERAVAQLDAYETAALAPELTPRERLIALGDAYLRFALDHPRAFRLMAFAQEDMSGVAGPAAERRARIDAQVEMLIARLTGIVSQMVGVGQTPAIDAPRAARFLWGAWNGVIALHLFSHTPVEGEIAAVLAEGRRLLTAGFDALVGGATPNTSPSADGEESVFRG